MWKHLSAELLLSGEHNRYLSKLGIDRSERSRIFTTGAFLQITADLPHNAIRAAQEHSARSVHCVRRTAASPFGAPLCIRGTSGRRDRGLQ
jgi:hypothetical protein